MIWAYVAFVVCVAAYALVARRVEALNVTGPTVFLAIGLAVGLGGLSDLAVSIGPESEAVRITTSAALVLLLFSDAATVDWAALRRSASWPFRLLLIGLPLTVLLGCGVAMGLLPGVSLGVAALIAAILAPTDLSLGLAMFKDERVPPRVSRAVNVESGLNDGIAAPLVTLFIALAISEFEHGAAPLREAVVEIALGVVVGVVVGAAGAWALRVSRARGWSSAASRSFACFALALTAYGIALATHGNGFVAAFVGGLAYGAVGRSDAAESAEYSEETGTLLTLVVWFVLGVSIGPVLLTSELAWQSILYAVLSLTVIRMLPVAVALVGTHARPQTILFAGWFGPRGLASVVFLLQALHALHTAGMDVATLAAAVGWTVVLSVILHGASAGPIAGWYGALAQDFPAEAPELTAVAPVARRRGLASPSRQADREP